MNYSGKLTSKIVIKKDYVRADGNCALYLQVFVNKTKKKFPLYVSVKLNEFDEKKQRVTSSNPLHKDLNLIIEKKLSELNTIQVNYRLSGTNLTMDNLINELENPTSRIDFIKFWENEMSIQENILKESTYKEQMSKLRKLKSYKEHLFFYEIDDQFLIKIKGHFKKQGNSENTITAFIKSFKKYLHIANKRGIISPLQFDDIKNKRFESRCTFLMPEEINKLYKYYSSEFINSTHKSILQRFLFSCFTGLRISDIQKITHNNIIGNVLIFTTTKTDKINRIQLNKTALKFIGKENVFENSYSDQHINDELKSISKVVGIKKHITFHVSRHSFATNFLMSGGRVEVLKELLGHRNISETMKYVHIIDSVKNEQIYNMDEIIKD